MKMCYWIVKISLCWAAVHKPLNVHNHVVEIYAHGVPFLFWSLEYFSKDVRRMSVLVRNRQTLNTLGTLLLLRWCSSRLMNSGATYARLLHMLHRSDLRFSFKCRVTAPLCLVFFAFARSGSWTLTNISYSRVFLKSYSIVGWETPGRIVILDADSLSLLNLVSPPRLRWIGQTCVCLGIVYVLMLSSYVPGKARKNEGIRLWLGLVVWRIYFRL